MLIAVVSDTHRIQIYIDKVKEMIKKADILIHLGDNVDDAEYISKGFKGKVYVVRGNCDFSTKYPSEEIIRLDEKTIFITHGHNYSVKSSLTNIFYKGKEVMADIVLFGHTHESIILEEENMILMNPGSASLPRNSQRSIGFIEVEEGKKPSVYLKEIK